MNGVDGLKRQTESEGLMGDIQGVWVCLVMIRSILVIAVVDDILRSFSYV